MNFQCFADNLGRDQDVEHQDHRAFGPARQACLEVVQPEEGGGRHEPVRTQHAQIAVGRGGRLFFTLKVSNYYIFDQISEFALTTN